MTEAIPSVAHALAVGVSKGRCPFTLLALVVGSTAKHFKSILSATIKLIHLKTTIYYVI